VNDLGLDSGRVVNQASLKAISLGIFEQTFTVTAALNVLTLAVAGFALLMSLLTLASIRLPQLAPVWALGLRRATLGRLELLRAVGLAALTALAALPLGLALAWVLLAVVNVEAFAGAPDVPLPLGLGAPLRPGPPRGGARRPLARGAAGARPPRPCSEGVLR
jgi:putative ABC transport system permease protein